MIIYNKLYDSFRSKLYDKSTIMGILNTSADGLFAAWAWKVPITVVSAKMPSGVIDFPVYISEANLPANFFANIDNGGGDLRASSDSAGANRLPLEIVRCDTAASKAEIFIKGPQSGDTFYLWYGNAGQTQPAATESYGRNVLWADYSWVAHLGQDPSGSAPQITDSTASGLNGTSGGSMTSADVVASAVGNGLDFDGTNDYVGFGTNSIFSFTGGTIETVAKPAVVTGTKEMASKTAASPQVGWFLGVVSSKWALWWSTLDKALYDIQLTSITSAVAGQEDHVAITYDNIGKSSLAVSTKQVNHGASAIDKTNGKIYQFGGRTQLVTTPADNTQIYDIASDSWANGTAMTTPRISASAAIVGGVIYVMGGGTGTNGATPSVKNEAYNIAGNSWSAKTDCPIGVAGVMSVAIGTDIYLTNGSALYRYDTVGNSWSAALAAPLATGTYPAICTDGTDLYILGGYNTGAGLRTIQKYTVSSNTWSVVSALLPTAVWAGSADIYNGHLYHAFGRRGIGVYKYPEMTKINLSTNAVTVLPEDTWAGGDTLAAGIYGDKFYFLGLRSGGKSDDFQLMPGYNSKFDLTTEVWLTSPATLMMYVNGVLENWATVPISMPAASTAPFNLGSYNNGAGLFYSGVVAEARFRSDPLTANEVLTSYNNLKAVSTFFTTGTAVEV